MTNNAGERLFQAMEQIPDDIILEAAQEQIIADTAESDSNKQAEAVQGNKDSNSADAADGGMAGTQAKKLPRWNVLAQKLNGYFKYLPVAACLCIVFFGAYYVIINSRLGVPGTGIHTEGGYAGGASDGTVKKEEAEMDLAREESAKQDHALENEAATGGAPESGIQSDGGTNEETQEGVRDDAGSDGSIRYEATALPARYDAYEGPVFALTATGDTQKLRISRSLKADILADPLPVMQIADTYEMKNTSDADKTLQIVYPFVTAFREAWDDSLPVLSLLEEPEVPISYSIGESICAYRGADLSETSSMEDYEQLFDAEADYQEQALEKEAGWNQKVQVYTFSNIRLKENAQDGASGIVGVTVSSQEAKVLTYGFDHSFEREDGSSNHCFFLPGEQKKLVLIVTGDLEEEPRVGYYSNLDCVERLDISSLDYDMRKQEMSYTNALRICSKEATDLLCKALAEETGEEAAPYINAEAALRALTMIGEEEDFYNTLQQRYQSTELREVFERIFGETRVVFARATITIPAGKSVQVAARTQKRKQQETQEYAFDFFSAAHSQLPLKKTAFRLTVEDGLSLTEQNLGLKQKKASVWKAVLSKKPYSFSVTMF